MLGQGKSFSAPAAVPRECFAILGGDQTGFEHSLITSKGTIYFQSDKPVMTVVKEAIDYEA